MSFQRGKISATVFEIKNPIPEDFVAMFAMHKACQIDHVTDVVNIGWVTGHHLLDNDITEESARQGGGVCLTLRKAVREIPPVLFCNLCRRAELAYQKANQLEYVPRKIKTEIKEDIRQQYLPKMPPAIGGISFVLDPETKLMFVGATGETQIDLFVEYFFKTTKIEPLQMSPAYLLAKDFKLTSSDLPELKIVNTDAEPNIGRDFLLWLWYWSETGGTLELEEYGKFDIMIDPPLMLVQDEANGVKDISIKNGGCPLKALELKTALQIGKKLKRANLTVARDRQVWTATFDADRFAFGSIKLPEGEEINLEEIVAERVESLKIFWHAIEQAFCNFCEDMLTDDKKVIQHVQAWVKERETAD